jgi:long-subunit fatty acid transport protein
MKSVLAFLFVIFLVYSQVNEQNYNESFHASGFGNMTRAIVSEISASNPANVSNFRKLSAGLSYEYETKDNSFNKAYQYLPYSFGIIFPGSVLDFAVAYNKKYSLSPEIEEIFLENFFKYNHLLSSFSVMASKSFYINKEHKINFGAQINENTFFVNWNHIDRRSAVNWKIGMNYYYHFLSLGFVYEDKLKFLRYSEKYAFGFSFYFSDNYTLAGTYAYRKEPGKSLYEEDFSLSNVIRISEGFYSSISAILRGNNALLNLGAQYDYKQYSFYLNLFSKKIPISLSKDMIYRFSIDYSIE